jgi:photosystem II stability/assembly factor-like uncharacterized protein
MLDQNNGWGTGGLAEGDDHTLRTSDGGLTWTDVTPREVPKLGPEFPNLAIGSFIGPEIGWIRYQDSFAIWSTTDGGVTWQVLDELLKSLERPIANLDPMQFIDEKHGWLLVYEGSGMGHDFSSLYATSDGGVSWEKLIDPVTNPAVLQSCCKTGVVFYDTRVGLVTYEQGPSVHPFVEWTNDGGASWTNFNIYLSDEDPSPANEFYCKVHSPHLFSSITAVIGMSCTEYGEVETITHNMFMTLDGGATWSNRQYPGSRLLFLNSETGWSLGPDLYATSDGGQSWTFLSSVDWEGQFTFIDALNGWAIAEGGRLFRTEDSGKTWSQLEPRVGSVN